LLYNFDMTNHMLFLLRVQVYQLISTLVLNPVKKIDY